MLGSVLLDCGADFIMLGSVLLDCGADFIMLGSVLLDGRVNASQSSFLSCASVGYLSCGYFVLAISGVWTIY
ncbi:hypothetical protein BgiMline_022078 [Biomphalaria glabrata]